MESITTKSKNFVECSTISILEPSSEFLNNSNRCNSGRFHRTPRGAVAHGFAGRDLTDLDHRQRQAHDRTRAIERQAAVQADAGAAELEMIARAKQDAPRRAEERARFG